MKTLFDTSVIVPALVWRHPFHESSFHQLSAARNQGFAGCLSTHSLAETFSTLTRLPTSPRISPHDAWRFLASLLDGKLELIPLMVKDYRHVLAQASASGWMGGIIYDALIVQAARKAGATRILTFNPDHFRRVCAEEMMEIISP